MHQTRRSRKLPAPILALIFLAQAAAAGCTTMTQPFRGVTHFHDKLTTPRLINVHVVKIDLRDPAIRFMVTAPNGPGVPGETTVETTRAFARRTGVQIAINTSFYSAATMPYVDNLNVAVADGVRYSTFTQHQPALAISRDNTARIVMHDPRDKTGYKTIPPVKLWNAVGGNELILKNGTVVAHDRNLHPRTAAGVSADGKTLLLLVADGRNPLHSRGLTTLEAAEILKRHGAVDALNLDGGGSSTLVIADPRPRVVNVPVGLKDIPFTERPVGQNLGIFAARNERKP